MRIQKSCSLIFFLFWELCALSVCAQQASRDIFIGVLSHRGDKAAYQTWLPVARYLNQQLAPLHFRIVPLDFHQIESMVGQKKIDFLLVNPGIYVNMEVKYRISRLVTLNKMESETVLNQFAGVAFTRADREDIQTYADLRDKTFVAVDKTSLGGYQMVWREMDQLHISPQKDFARLAFAGTHDRVVMAVKDRQYDAGTVRTGILEKMARTGQIKLKDFRIISAQKHEGFPLLHSTRLYPEWPFSKLHHTDNQLAQKVAMVLMQMPDQHLENLAIDYSGWTIPLDYQEVHKLFEQLALPPYQKTDFTLRDAIQKYWFWLLLICLCLLLLLLLSLWIIRLNHQLKQSKYRLELEHDLILDSVCDGIYGINPQGECTFVNKSMQKITGWTRDDLIGKNQHTLLHHTRADGTPHPLEQCPVYVTIQEKQPRFVARDIFWKKDGSSFPVEYSSTPVKDRHNQVVGSVVVFRDISERIAAEENKRRFQEELMHMSRLNTMGEMASGIAHELNQPLTAISTRAFSAINLLESGRFNTNQLIDILEQISTQAEKSGKIIKQLRKFVKKELPEKERIDLVKLIEEILELLKPDLQKYQISVAFHYQKNLPKVLCQPIQIDQVILNLCKNAIEAMRDANLTVRKLTLYVSRAEHHSIIVSIADTGHGIPENMRASLFDPFITSKDDGMGLGLSICKGIIDAHNGEIYVAENSHKGCHFRFTLPLDREI